MCVCSDIACMCKRKTFIKHKACTIKPKYNEKVLQQLNKTSHKVSGKAEIEKPESSMLKNIYDIFNFDDNKWN